jgi:hypothetical protein
MSEKRARSEEDSGADKIRSSTTRWLVAVDSGDKVNSLTRENNGSGS